MRYFNKQNKSKLLFLYTVLWYGCMLTALITSGVKKWVAITASWPCCHGCHLITVWWNCLIFEGLLQIWLILMFIILVCLYFVKNKSYEHSLIIYWTALVLKMGMSDHGNYLIQKHKISENWMIIYNCIEHKGMKTI